MQMPCAMLLMSTISFSLLTVETLLVEATSIAEVRAKLQRLQIIQLVQENKLQRLQIAKKTMMTVTVQAKKYRKL